MCYLPDSGDESKEGGIGVMFGWEFWWTAWLQYNLEYSNLKTLALTIYRYLLDIMNFGGRTVYLFRRARGLSYKPESMFQMRVIVQFVYANNLHSLLMFLI